MRYIPGNEPAASYIEELPGWIPEVTFPKWPKIDTRKLLTIAGGFLTMLGLGWLVKILSSIMIDNSKKIQLLDYMNESLYQIDSDTNWTIGCPLGDTMLQSK